MNYYGSYGGFGGGPFMFTFIPLMIGVIFIIMVILIIKGLLEWNKNNHSPVLAVDASVVAKRTSVTHHASTENTMGHESTSYYVTFQVKSGDRIEFSVRGKEYGMIAEGDQGKLRFQGTRYLEFNRI